jgi:hypothetical protein
LKKDIMHVFKSIGLGNANSEQQSFNRKGFATYGASPCSLTESDFPRSRQLYSMPASAGARRQSQTSLMQQKLSHYSEDSCPQTP